MNETDRQRFGIAIVKLAETLGEQMSQPRLEGYFEALMDLSIESLEAAIAHAKQGNTFFPKPAELRELANNWRKRQPAQKMLPPPEEERVSPEEIRRLRQEISRIAVSSRMPAKRIPD